VEPSSGVSRQSPRPALNGVVVTALAAVVVISVLLVASAPPWAQLLSSALAVAVAGVAIAARSRVRWVPFATAAAAGVGMTIFQLIPLPALLVRLVSPHALELRAGAMGRVPAMIPLTLEVPATVIEVCKGVACLALLLVAVAAAKRPSRARLLTLTLAYIGGVVALIHVVQRTLGARSILGLFPLGHLPGSGFFGTFVNGNQASALFSLSALVAAGVAMESEGVLCATALASVVLSAGTLLSTGSRSGPVGLGFGVLILIALRLERRLGRLRAVLLATALAVSIGAGALWVTGGLEGRLVAAGATDRNSQKLRGWRDTLTLVSSYRWTGVGRGAFEAPATAFRTNTEGVRLSFPENVLLQLGAEWGLLFTLALAALVIGPARRIGPALARLDPSTQGAACGVIAVVVHDLADFSLELPGVAFPTVAALGLLVGRVEALRISRPEKAPRLAPGWMAAGMAVAVAALVSGLWAVPRTLQADGLRLKETVASSPTRAGNDLAAAIRRHPADYYLELLAATAAIASRDALGAGPHLNRAQQLSPRDPTVHVLTARWLVGAGRRSQAAIEYRLAADNGGVSNLDELLAAVGPLRIASAVAQTDAALMQAADYLIKHNHIEAGRQASARAVEIGNGAEGPLIDRLRLAVASGSASFVQEAAGQLLAAATEPESFTAAADALTKAGLTEDAERAVRRGLAVHPTSGLLFLASARVKLAMKDLPAVSAVLRDGAGAIYTLTQRIELETLRATILDQQGDHVDAAAARARARLISRETTTAR
jgi:hypothetical protein